MAAASDVCCVLERRSLLDKGRQLISYIDFSQCREETREKYGNLYDACFLPRVFLSFPGCTTDQDPAENPTVYIETRFVQKYIHEFARVLKVKKELELLSTNGTLTTEGIESYTTRKLRPLYALVAKNRTHLAAACKLATMKFRFYHERRGELKIDDVAMGFTMYEMEKALLISKSEDTSNGQRALSNWFSEKVIFGVIDSFARAAGGYHTALSLSQFVSIPAFSTLSPSFTLNLFKRVKEATSSTSSINASVENIMELEMFGNLVVAWNDRSSDIAVRYLFKIFDIHDKGYLTFMDLHDFVEETVELLAMAEPAGVYEGMPRDIVIEILDMVGAEIQGKVTAKDIIACKNGSEIFGMLADATELHRHEHKDD